MLDGKGAYSGFNATGCTQLMPRHGLGGTHHYPLRMFGTHHLLDGVGFDHVPLGRAGSVGIDVIHVIHCQPGIFDRKFHGPGGTVTRIHRRGHVIGVTGGPKAGHFTVNVRTPGLGRLQFLYDDDSRTISNHKPVAVRIKRTTGLLRFVIARTERLHFCKPAHAKLTNGCFRAAGHHDICVSALDHSLGHADRMRRRGAGRHNAEVRPLQVVLNRDQAGGHVGNHLRNHEWRTTGWAFFHQGPVLILQGLQSPDSGSDQCTKAFRFNAV